MTSQAKINDLTSRAAKTASRAKNLRSAPKSSPIRAEAVKHADAALESLIAVERPLPQWLAESHAQERGEDWNSFESRRREYT